MHRAALEAEFFPEPALDEPAVPSLQEAGGEQHEMRRPDPGLGREQDLGLLAAANRRRSRRDKRGEPAVEPPRRHPRLPAGQGELERRDQPVYVPAGRRRDIDPWCPAGGVQLPVDLAVQEVPAVLVHQVPLVVRDDQGPAGVDHHRHDPQILLRKRLAGIHEYHGHLGPLERALCPHRGEVVSALGLVYPPPDTGGVDEAPDVAAELDELIDRVPGGAGLRVDEHPLLPGELVQQARLADVGAAEQGHPPGAAVRGDGLGRRGWQCVEDHVEEVTAPPAVQRAHRNRLAEPERPERCSRRLTRGIVDLVGGQDDRLAGPAQHGGDGLVGVGDADDGISDEQHCVRCVYREPCLSGHSRGQGR